MISSLILSCLVAVATVTANSSDFQGYKVLRILPINDAQVKYLSELDTKASGMELDFWLDVSTAGNPVDINVGPKDLPRLTSELKARGIMFSSYVDDVQKSIDQESETQGRHAYGFSGFDYGQYHTYTEIQAELRNINRQYASITSMINFGSSYEKRTMEGIKISLGSSAGKKIVFIDCGIHAREWISPATCMYLLNKIVTGYKKDHSIQEALKKYDIIILPVFNVDGFEYTHTRNTRARLWRKTRSYYRGCYGADPNRNWDFKWGGAGTSPDPCRDTYHGTGAFSEIEVLNVARYLYSIRDRLVSYYNIHAYSQMWLTPWSYTSVAPKDYQAIELVAKAGVSALSAKYGTQYTYGPPPRLLYAVAGGSIDWTYGTLGVVYSYALELRDKGRYGFLLPASQIKPTGEETTDGLLAAINAM